MISFIFIHRHQQSSKKKVAADIVIAATETKSSWHTINNYYRISAHCYDFACWSNRFSSRRREREKGRKKKREKGRERKKKERDTHTHKKHWKKKKFFFFFCCISVFTMTCMEKMELEKLMGKG